LSSLGNGPFSHAHEFTQTSRLARADPCFQVFNVMPLVSLELLNLKSWLIEKTRRPSEIGPVSRVASLNRIPWYSFTALGKWPLLKSTIGNQRQCIQCSFTRKLVRIDH